MKRALGPLSLILLLGLVCQPWQHAGAASTLPADAAPLDQQVLHLQGALGGPFLDWSQTIYNRADGTNIIQEPLTRNNFQTFAPEPAAATSWDVSKDGLTWTFHMRKGMVWSDGQPLTADDFVFTFRHQADPKTGYDFVYYPESVQQVHNWAAVNAGKMPLTALGVAAPDPYTFQITTDTPRPFLPATMGIVFPEPAHLVSKYGVNWATKLSTMAFSGPYMPQEWKKNQYILLVPNPTYHGVYTHYLQKIYLGFGSATLADYQAGTVDSIGLDAGTLPAAMATMPKEVHNISTFGVHYLTFNTFMKPFNDVRLRQAFSMAIDRDLLSSSVLKNVARPAYALLMPNFPGYNPAIKQTFDPAKARALLAQAGYPGGKGFPQLTIWVRGVGTQAGNDAVAAEFVQGQLQKNLGISISVAQYDFKTFTDAINNHKQPIMLVPYDYDYVDPSNFMDLFITGGRHAWSNKQYDTIVKKADSTIDAKTRKNLYDQAQMLMIKEAPTAFLFTNVGSMLWKSRFRNVPTSVINNTLDNDMRVYVAKQ